MVTAKISAMDRVKHLYENRSLRAKELRAQGKKIIGYFCCYPPIEFLTALHLVPFRIQGTVKEPITKADAYLETIMCPFMRSCFDLALKGQYDFLNGLVVPHSCDTVQRIYEIWRHYRKPEYTHFINVPHMLDATSYEFFKRELESFQRSLEEYTGLKLTQERLDKAIGLHNQNRSLLRELYELRKTEPPLISGAEITQLQVAGMGLPVEEYNELIRQVIQEVDSLPNRPEPKPRLLVFGSEMDDSSFIQLVEDCGANVVMDDLCTATRCFWQDVKATPDRLDGLVDRYLGGINCPRTYRPKTGSHKEDVVNRFGYLLDYARDFGVQGVVFYIIRFCDTYEFDVPDVRDYLEENGFPVLHLEDDYSVFTIGQLRTRIQAFLETMG